MLTDSGWTSSPPSTYTIAAEGSYTLYPWVRDEHGNISAVYSWPATVNVDVTAPTVTSFSADSSSTDLSIDINSITASDNVGITGYMITESDTAPAAGDSAWTASAPTSFALSDYGSYTLYPWARDQTGNVSALYDTPATGMACYPGDITVTSNADDGPGTLRQAIDNICAGNTIDFDSALSGDTIRLNSILTISKNVAIDGSALASPITISGDSDNNGSGDVRVFAVSSGVTATLNRLHITKGWDSLSGGGGLRNDGTAHVINSVFSANSVDNQYGGAIFNSVTGILTVAGSTFSGNAAYNGGAIANFNQLTITNSTFSANTSLDAGGAVYTSDLATYNPTVTMTIANSTLVDNAGSFGGGVFSSRTATITNSTFSGNASTDGVIGGGAIWQDAETLNLSNSILANSLAPTDCYSQSAIGININNLIEIGGGSCSASLTGDPGLDSLKDNGGSTPTMALLAGSPAIDAGDDTTCAASPVSNLDQRGVTRPNGAHCDIGAYEYVDTTAPTINTFMVTSPSTSLAVPITAFTASDDVTVAGYLVTESSTPPSAGATGWTVSAPTTYTVAGDGSYTLYPWAKDVAGNVSAVYGSPASVIVETTAPSVVSSARVTTSATKAASVSFLVTFSEAVTGVDTSDFRLTSSGVTGASITGVSGSGKARTISVNTGSGSGTLRLDVQDNDSIIDGAGNPIDKPSVLTLKHQRDYTILADASM